MAWSATPPTAAGWYWVSLTSPLGSPALTISREPGQVGELGKFARAAGIEILYWSIPIVEPAPPAPFLCDECHARDHVVTDCPIVVRRTGGVS